MKAEEQMALSHEVNRIRGAMSSGRYSRLLTSISIRNLRGFPKEEATRIDFQFPVTAIVGENGTGKTTVIKAAACAYEQAGEGRSSFQPGRFFMNTAWDTVTDVEITCRLSEQANPVTIRKPTDRWRISSGRPNRHIFLLDVSRVMPLDALMGYAQVTKRSNREASSETLAERSINDLGYILNRDFSAARFASTTNSDREVGILAQRFGDYSAFHQGAGEAASLQLFRTLERIPNDSLLLIDEVDASLHPKAQRRLVQQLLKISREKGIQVILTTHSSHVLEEIPPEARILLQRNRDRINVIHGATPEFCLSAIDDRTHPDITVFCEDDRAATMISALVAASHDPYNVETYPVGSYSVVKQLADLSAKGSLPYPAAGVVDGSKTYNSCVSLPGKEEPELVVFRDLKEKNWPDVEERFGIRFSEMSSILDEAMRRQDIHDWPLVVGDRIRRSKDVVWDTLVTLWVQKCVDQAVIEEFSADVRSKSKISQRQI
ncbi:AAA family ATPase [Nonomuraea sp. NPDC048916]|uniref:ATP-dependent nuclease n=1 Tax=Nonomuraea sp. NPDC048916 TaxID=3154232 RepID=UPI0033E320D1